MKRLAALALVAGAALAGIFIWQTTLGATPSSPPSSTATAASVLPVTANPITATGTASGLAITQAMVENNIDPLTKADAPDRLQFTLANSAAVPISGLEIYYTTKDTTTGQTESYYRKLDGLTLAPGQDTTIYFDNGTEPGHYPENKYSLYRTSANEVQFTIEAAASGFAPASATATKSKGTGEAKD